MARTLLVCATAACAAAQTWTNLCPGASFSALSSYVGSGSAADGTTLTVQRTAIYITSANDSIIDQLCPTAVTPQPDGSAYVFFGNVTTDFAASCALLNVSTEGVRTVTFSRSLPRFTNSSVCPTNFTFDPALAANLSVTPAAAYSPFSLSPRIVDCPDFGVATVDASLRGAPRWVQRTDGTQFTAVEVTINSIYMSRQLSLSVSRIMCVFNSTNVTDVGARFLAVRYGNPYLPSSISACVLANRTSDNSLAIQELLPSLAFARNGSVNVTFNASDPRSCPFNMSNPQVYFGFYTTQSPTPSPTASVTATATSTSTISITATSTFSAGASQSVTPTRTASPSATLTPIARLSDGVTLNVTLRFPGNVSSNATLYSNITAAMQRDIAAFVSQNLFPMLPTQVFVTTLLECTPLPVNVTVNVTGNVSTNRNCSAASFQLLLYIPSPNATAGMSAAALNASLLVAVSRGAQLARALASVFNGTNASLPAVLTLLPTALPALAALSFLPVASLVPTVVGSINVTTTFGVLPVGMPSSPAAAALSDGGIAAIVIVLGVVPLVIVGYLLTPHGKRTLARMFPNGCAGARRKLSRNASSTTPVVSHGYESAGVVTVNYAPILALGTNGAVTPAPAPPPPVPAQVSAATMPAGVPMTHSSRDIV